MHDTLMFDLRFYERFLQAAPSVKVWQVVAGGRHAQGMQLIATRHLEMDGWKTTFLPGRCYVNFREGISCMVFGRVAAELLCGNLGWDVVTSFDQWKRNIFYNSAFGEFTVF